MSCPICQKDSDPKYRPFCSRRCADVDLGKWLTGSYAIADESALDDLGEGEGVVAPGASAAPTRIEPKKENSTGDKASSQVPWEGGQQIRLAYVTGVAR